MWPCARRARRPTGPWKPLWSVVANNLSCEHNVLLLKYFYEQKAFVMFVWLFFTNLFYYKKLPEHCQAGPQKLLMRTQDHWRELAPE